MHVPPDVDVRAIRRGLGMTQDAFAFEFSFSINQIRDWKKGRGRPLDSNRAYLLIIERHPEAVRRMLAEMRTDAAIEDANCEDVHLAM